MSVELRKLFWANVLVTTDLAAKPLDRNTRIRWAIARDQLKSD